MISAGESPVVKGGHENWIPLLDTAAREVFELMLGSQLTAWASAEELNLDVTSMVGLAGQLCGVLSVRCDGEAAALMTSKMLGLPLDKVGPEVADAVGEVCNMVAGNFKNKIAGLGDGCMLSVPTVITGTEYNLHSMVSDEIRTVVLFEGEPVVLCLEVHS